MSAAKPQDCTLCSHVALYLPWHTGMVPGAWSYLPAAAETLGLSAMNVLRSGSEFIRILFLHFPVSHNALWPGPWRHAAPSHGARHRGSGWLFPTNWTNVTKFPRILDNRAKFSPREQTSAVQSVSVLRLRRLGCIENTETDTGLCVHWIGTCQHADMPACHGPAIVQTNSRAPIICTTHTARLEE